MTLYTMGFTKKSAETFFCLLSINRVRLIADIRLNNASQLAGFTKGGDLAYFVKTICGAEYQHFPELAPSRELLEGYRQGTVSWEEYEIRYRELLDGRRAAGGLSGQGGLEIDGTCLLCSEETPEKCHRRLAAEYLREMRPGQDIEIVHL